MSKTKMKHRHRRQINTEWVECDCGKRAYSSRYAAKRGVARAGNKVRLYICPFSGKWHVTSSDKEGLES
jgi:hypothetical protein